MHERCLILALVKISNGKIHQMSTSYKLNSQNHNTQSRPCYGWNIPVYDFTMSNF